MATQIKIDTNSKSKCFVSILSSYNFKVSQTFRIPHPGSPRPPRNFVQPEYFFNIYICLGLWRPINVFGVALQTCLGGMFPRADMWDLVQLSPRLSDFLHVLSLAGTQQLGYLRGEGDFSGTGWETQDKVWQCSLVPVWQHSVSGLCSSGKKGPISCWGDGMCHIFNCSVAKLRLCPVPLGQREPCVWDNGFIKNIIIKKL